MEHANASFRLAVGLSVLEFKQLIDGLGTQHGSFVRCPIPTKDYSWEVVIFLATSLLCVDRMDNIDIHSSEG